MNHMLQFGPSELNGVMVYEHLALEGLATAQGRWGKIKVIYPTRTVWNDNPFYILDVPWSSADQRTAARLFQDFLLGAASQQVARDQYRFRPANLEVPIVGGGSAFDRLQDVVRIDVPTIQKPKGEVLEQLIQVWKRTQ
jgi:ABC-type Fe3+ transport system substrate-binding protein